MVCKQAPTHLVMQNLSLLEFLYTMGIQPIRSALMRGGG